MGRTFYFWTRDLHLYIGLALSPLVLLFAISVILLDQRRLQTMSAKSREMRRIDAGEVIVRECYALMGVTHDIDRFVGAAGV